MARLLRTVLRGTFWLNRLLCLSHFGNDAMERSDGRDAGDLDTFAAHPCIDVG